jgi:hypothetical protein
MHRFEATSHLDVFDSAMKLILNWEKLFPGQKLRGSVSDKSIVLRNVGRQIAVL